MSTKPRSDAALKTLPPDRQADIAEHLRSHSLAETAKWLADDGFKTSSRALSEFRSWHALAETLRDNDSTVQALLADLKSAKPGMTPDELDAAGQMFFTALSINQKDSLGWKRAQDVKIKSGVLKLNWDKFRFDAVQACRKQLPALKSIEANKSLSEAEKTDAFMEKLFGKKPA